MNKAYLQETHCPIPMIVQWREDSKIIEASAENDFRFQRLLGMVCTMESKEMILPRRPLYFTDKVLPCYIIVETKCLCTGRARPCVQRHFAKIVIYLIFVSCIRWHLTPGYRPVAQVVLFDRICVLGQFVI